MKNNLSEYEALELEQKLITKIGLHYINRLVNIDGNDYDTIFINDEGYGEDRKNLIKYSDGEIVKELLNFKNENYFIEIKRQLQFVQDFFDKNYDKLEEEAEDTLYDIEGVFNSLNDYIEEGASSPNLVVNELIDDLEYELDELRDLKEEVEGNSQKKFLKLIIARSHIDPQVGVCQFC